MNWDRENRWLGNFLFTFASGLLIALWFLFHAKGEYSDAAAHFNEVATERIRLEHLNPFPNEENLRKTQAALRTYEATLNRVKEDLKSQVVPVAPLAPNEFQTRLREAIANVAERARVNRVKLPDKFHLGFDEFTASLPDPAAAPVLGQQLAQVELLANILIDNRVDAITGLKRSPPARASAVGRKPSQNGAKVIERSVVDIAFTASPTAFRKALNQITSFDRQFFIVRTLHVYSDQQKGPPREQAGSAPAATPAPNAATSPGAIKFIVGNEHLEASASVELVRFTF